MASAMPLGLRDFVSILDRAYPLLSGNGVYHGCPVVDGTATVGPRCWDSSSM